MTESFSLLAEHRDFLVINKVCSCNFHSQGDEPGLLAQVRASTGLPLWPVHRLDKMTSGLLLLARSEQAAADFGHLFAGRALEKYYLAIGRGKPKKKQGLIAGDMLRSRRRAWKLSGTRDNPAITQFFSAALAPGLRAFLLRPHTGKTHQLRVALNSLGSPVAGDDIYDAAHAAQYDRGYLHAWCLRFLWRGEPCQFLAEPEAGELFLTPAFADLLTQFRPPWQRDWPVLPAGLVTGQGAAS